MKETAQQVEEESEGLMAGAYLGLGRLGSCLGR